MTKVNPATKAANELEQDGSESIETMLEKYKEMKELSSSRLHPQDVVDKLPSYAELEGGELYIITHDDDRSNRKKFTPKRRKILQEKADHPDLNIDELTDKCDSSQSHVYRTIRFWSFLLKDHELFEAFVLDGRVPNENWRVVKEDGEELNCISRMYARKEAKRLWKDEGVKSNVVSPSGEEFPLSEFVDVDVDRYESSPSGESEESQDRDVVTAQANLSSTGGDEDTPSGVELELSVGQFSGVLKSLYEADRDELAESLLEQVMFQ